MALGIDEFIVNQTTSGSQEGPRITALANGGYAVAWEDYGQTGDDTSDTAVRARVFNADGSPSGNDFLVNTTTSGGQTGASITALLNDRFVVAWKGPDGSFAQVFDLDGSKHGRPELPLGTHTYPVIAGLSDGRFVAVMQYSGEVPGQVFNDDGSQSTPEFRVPAPMGVDRAVAALPGGRFVAATNGVVVQVFNADGTTTGYDEIHTESGVGGPQIAALTNGNFVVTWQNPNGFGDDLSNSAQIAQIFDGHGVKIGREFLVNSTTTGSQESGSIAALPNGRFIITFESNIGRSGPEADVRARVFNADGSPSGNDFLVNSVTPGKQYSAAVAVTTDGSVVVVWKDDNNVVGGHDIRGVQFRLDDPLDTTPPSAPAITGFVDDTGTLGDGITSDNTLTLSGTAEAGTSVRLFDGLTDVGSATATGGAWSITTAALGDGPHSLTAKARDAAGNESGASAALAVTVDSVAPVAGALSFTGLIDTGSDDNPDITSDSTFGLSLAGNEAGTVAYEMSTNGGGSWTTTGTSQSGLADGRYQFRAMVMDAAGNSATTAAILVTIDTTAPGPGTFSTVNFDDFNRADGAPSNGWSKVLNDDGLVISGGALTTPGGPLDGEIFRPIDLSGPVTVSATITHTNGFGGLLYRYAALFTFGTDGSGGPGSTGDDGLSPGYAVSFGRGDQNYNDSAVELLYNSTRLESLPSTFQYREMINVTFTLSPDGSIAGTVVGDGNTFGFSFAARPIVYAGSNFSMFLAGPDPRTSVLTYPTIDNLTIIENPRLPGTLPGTLSFVGLTDTGSDDNPDITSDSTFGLSLTGNEAGTTVAYEVSSNGGSSWTTTGASQSGLADGSYQFRAVVTDAAGNAANTAPVLVTIDTAAPTFVQSNPADDATGILIGTNITLTFSEVVHAGTGNIVVTDDNGISQSFAIGGPNVTVSGSTATLDLPSDLAALTVYGVSVTAGALLDAAGNGFAGLGGATAIDFATQSLVPVAPTPGNGNDVLVGGSGDNTISSGNGDDSVYGLLGNDNLSGGSGGDFLAGGAGDDILDGGIGNDLLDGGSGEDTLNGNSGNDTLNGGLGNDVLTGDTGNDRFVIGANGGHDTITDYKKGNDTIDLSSAGFTSYADLLAHSTVSNGNTLVTIDVSNSVLLMGVTLANNNAGDFIL